VSGVVSANAFIARALVAAGRADEAKKLLATIEAGDDYVRHEFMAPAYAALGDVDRAMTALETAYEERSAGLVYLHVDPSYHLLRGDERYQALVERIGLKSS
jgi:hypothetical protein